MSLRVSTPRALHLGLLGAHVLERADDRAELREHRLLGQPLGDRLGDAEVDHFRDRLAIVESDQHVGRLDVAVDHPLLMRVLDRLADRDEQLQPLARVEPGLVAILGDRDAIDELHDEVGSAAVGGTRIEDPGDVGMVHQGQSLALGLEPGDHLGGVHARLDNLQRDPAADGLLLLGHVDRAHTPLADLLEELVRTDASAGSLGDRSIGDITDEAIGRFPVTSRVDRQLGRDWQLEQPAGPLVGLE